MSETNSIKAIKYARTVFESIHGNLGILKFNIERLTSKNGTATEDSKKWEIICSFYETLGSTEPSRYEVMVDLNNNGVSIKKISGNEGESESVETYVIKEKGKDSASENE